MKTSYFVAIFLIVGIFLWYLNSGTSTPQYPGIVATVYKSQQCGCCGNYVSYLRGQGFTVQVKDVQDMTPIKQRFGIPTSMESCHTTIIGDYVVEGHIPTEAIQKMMNEKPTIKGIAMPGMPSASPGMPGSKTAPFKIYSMMKEEGVEEYMTI